MLLAFVFILLAIGVGILVSVYSIFLPFITNLGEIGNFNTAYYGAIAGIERAELILKHKGPGFEGSGGYLGDEKRGRKSDRKIGEFGFINQGNNGMRRKIKSRTIQIPQPNQGNIEYLLGNETSKNYNMLEYTNNEKFILSLDDTTDPGAYYTDAHNITTDRNGGEISGSIRLPSKIKSGFNNSELCTSCDINGDGLGDDTVINRALEGIRKGMNFKIIPNISVLYYSGYQVNTQKDIAIRESTINRGGNNIYLGNGGGNFNPIKDYTSNNLTKHIIIASNPSNIDAEPFNTIFTNGTFTGLELSLGLINKLISNNGNIYPFLEYQFSFTNPIADKFYTIQGNSRIGDYDVQIIIKKPTYKGSIAGSFTVIF